MSKAIDELSDLIQKSTLGLNRTIRSHIISKAKDAVVRSRIFLSLVDIEDKSIHKKIHDTLIKEVTNFKGQDSDLNRFVESKLNQLKYEEHVSESGYLRNQTDIDSELLNKFFDCHDVDRRDRASLVVIFRHFVCRPSDKLPKWSEKANYSNLSEMSAPQFLKYVYEEYIYERHIYKETIRSHDPDLMKAIEAYISQRERRGKDLGDAKDLVFVVSKPATNKVARPPPRAASKPFWRPEQK